MQTGGPSPFGVTLRQLLEEYDSSPRALAEQVQVDRSLVYRWLRDERIPPLNSEHIQAVAAALNLTRTQREALHASQVYSLGLPRASHARRPEASREVEDLLRRSHRSADVSSHQTRPPVPAIEPLSATLPPAVPLASSAGRRRSATNSRARSGVTLPAEPQVLRDRAALLRAGFELLANVPPPPDPTNNTIVVTALDRSEWGHEKRDAYYDLWTETLREVCARGWQISHVWKLDANLHRSFAAARMVLDLAGTCRYTMLSLPSYDRIIALHELLIIPGVAALISFPTVSLESVDGGLIFRGLDQVRLLQAHAQPLAQRAHALLEVYVADDGAALEGLSVEAEEQYAGRDLVKDGLSLITRPPEWYSPPSTLSQRSRLQGASLEAAISHRRRRIQAFERHVTHARYRDICPMDAIQRLVRDGHDMPTSLDQGVPVVPEKQRIAHIKHAIARLRAHERYELALVDTPERKRVPIAPHKFWEVVGGMRVCTHVTIDNPAGNATKAGVMIAEGTLVTAFQQYFDDLWERISPRNRDKDFVIWWLERQLEQIT